MALRDKIAHLFLKYLAVPKTPKIIPGKTHIACIGDSITFGAGVNGKTEQTWEYCLNQKLGDAYQVINYGISGRTLQNEGDYPYTVDKFYKISLESQAEIFIIMLGTNDSKPYNWNKERYERELDTFVKQYMSLAHKPRVILMTPPQCFPDTKAGIVLFDINAETIDNETAPIVRETAQRLGLQLIDLNEYTQGHPEWFADGVHPNFEGNQKIAEYIGEQL